MAVAAGSLAGGGEENKEPASLGMLRSGEERHGYALAVINPNIGHSGRICFLLAMNLVSDKGPSIELRQRMDMKITFHDARGETTGSRDSLFSYGDDVLDGVNNWSWAAPYAFDVPSGAVSFSVSVEQRWRVGPLALPKMKEFVSRLMPSPVEAAPPTGGK